MNMQQHMYSNPPQLPPAYALGYGSIGYDVAGEAEELLQDLSVSGEEIIGAGEEIIGWDTSAAEDLMGVEEIIGAALPPGPVKNAIQQRLASAKVKTALAKKPAAKPALNLPLQGTRVDVVPQVNRRHRLMVAGMGFTTVLLGAIATITILPQRLFKPKLLSIPGSTALYFAITGVFVGQDSQLAAAGAIPCECFTETAVNAPIDWDTANIGNSITLNIQNIEPVGGAPSRVFSGMIIGLGVKP